MSDAPTKTKLRLSFEEHDNELGRDKSVLEREAILGSLVDEHGWVFARIWADCPDAQEKVQAVIAAVNGAAVEPTSALVAIARELDASFDQQTHSEKVREEFDAPDDREYSVNITAKQQRALDRAVLETHRPAEPPSGIYTEKDVSAMVAAALAAHKARNNDLAKALDAINALIKTGPLPGNGCDKTAERNGLTLAYNAVWALIERQRLAETKDACPHEVTTLMPYADGNRYWRCDSCCQIVDPPAKKSACTCPPGLCCEKEGAAASDIRECRQAGETVAVRRRMQRCPHGVSELNRCNTCD